MTWMAALGDQSDPSWFIVLITQPFSKFMSLVTSLQTGYQLRSYCLTCYCFFFGIPGCHLLSSWLSLTFTDLIHSDSLPFFQQTLTKGLWCARQCAGSGIWNQEGKVLALKEKTHALCIISPLAILSPGCMLAWLRGETCYFGAV